jgi:hypothetical protein
MLVEMRSIHAELKGAYGSSSVVRELLQQCFIAGKE